MVTTAAPRNLVALLQQRAESSPNAPAAAFKVGGVWKEATWSQVLASAQACAAALLRLGVRPGDRVAVFSATRYEWTLADLGAMAAGAVVVPIYASNTAEETRYILADSGACVCVVDSDSPDGRQGGRLGRLRQAWGALPQLRAALLFDGQVPAEGPVRSWSEATAVLPTEAELAELATRQADLNGATLATLLYTSGTTGNPKGVELTHGNWVYEANATRAVGLMREHEKLLLFLPLAHSFAKVTEAAWLSLGFCMAFAESADRAVDNCAEVQPTILPAVPRIFEKIYLKVVGDGSAAPGLQGTLFRAAIAAFDEFAHAKLNGQRTPLRYELLKRLVFPKIKQRLDARLGGHMRLFISGGAPLARKLALFFEELGFEILEGYGLTETSAGTFVNPPGRARIGTVGPPMPGTEVRLATDGEILIRGPGVMRGYHGQPAATAEVLEPDGWFHTGDIGQLDAQGYLRITDRKKDIIVTAGGKNIAPQNLENELKTHPIVSQAMVYGDRRKFLSALITVNEEEARRLLGKRGLSAGSYEELCQKAPVREAVDQALQALNATLPSYETIKKYAVLTRDFSQESGELTPTLKVKRKVVTANYQSQLDGFYDEQLLD